MHRRSLRGALVLLPLFGAFPALLVEAQQPASRPDFTIRSTATDTTSLDVVYNPETDSLSVHAVSAPLANIIEAIAARAHIAITGQRESLGDRVSIRIVNSPLERALRQMLSDFNLAFVYAADRDATTGASSRLTKLIVVPRESKLSSPTSVAVERTERSRGIKRAPVPADDFALVRELVDGSVDVVRAIVGTLRQPASEQQRERVVETLLDRLADSRSPVPEGVIAVLKELAPEAATDRLLEDLQSGDPQMQARAAAYLGRFADERAVESLSRVLAAATPETGRPAATSLALIGSSSAVDALLKAYQTTDNRIRYPAWLAIVSHGSPQSQMRLSALIAKGFLPPAPPAKGHRSQ